MSHQYFLDKQLVFENDVRRICSDFLNSYGITYFNYLRYYNDGSCYLLATHGKLIEYHFEHNIPVAAPVSKKHIKRNFNYFILPIGSYNEIIHYAKNNLNVGYFIDLVDRYDNYMELFCFGSTPDNSEIVNFYLNNLDFLNNFKLYFKDRAVGMLKQGEQNKVILPELMKPPYQGLVDELGQNTNFIKKKNTYIKSRYGNMQLTLRQYDCLSQLASGHTAKETARNLGISHRTVENYLANLKSVLSCHRKSELVNIFLKNFKQ